MKSVAIIPARMDSTRLPGKGLLEISGQPMLSILLDRLRRSDVIDEIVLATTVRASDDALADWANAENIPIYRGSLENVLNRFLGAARSVQADLVFRANGDSPLLSPEWIERGRRQLEAEGLEFVTGKTSFTRLPSGIAGEWIKTNTLERLNRLVLDPEDLEHVTSYIFKSEKDFKWAPLGPVEPVYQNDSLRFVVDNKKDFEQLEEIINRIGPDVSEWSYPLLLETASSVQKDSKKVNL